MTEKLSDTQIQFSMSSLQQAVCVRRAHKRYGSNNNPVIILDGLDMTVPKGTIYGLLGASGCGKTTLLSCIIGRKHLNSGEIWVLGGTPGSKGSGVPGPRVGYMPQEIALYREFTIRETFKYFGWISGMKTEEIEHRLTFLTKLFLLPNADCLVKNLSGGQQRRVSLAIALLHKPELLILDEPTVGLDPLLRQNIWDHFVELTNHGRTTIIITTHYIEEARQAHKIGLMRSGYLLAEESPEALLSTSGCETLEKAFLKLSVVQNIRKINRNSIVQNVTESIKLPSGFINEVAVLDDEVEQITGELSDHSPQVNKKRIFISSEVTEAGPPQLTSDQLHHTKYSDYFQVIQINHLYTLMWKNFLWMWRNIPLMIFLMVLPVTQITLFCLSIGHDPKNLHLSVVNYELEDSEICKISLGCNSTRLSCNYLDKLQKFTLQLNFYSTVKEAKDSVRRGDSWATLVFASNFSDALKYRMEEGLYLPVWDAVASSVEVYQDNSDQNIATMLQRQLYLALGDFIKEHLVSCSINIKIGKPPLQWKKPIYGKISPEFTDFMAPGLMLIIIFFLAVASTSGSMLTERTEGMLERCLVNGITSVELLFSLIMTQFIIMASQAALVVLFTRIFNVENNGNLVWVTSLTLLTGLSGMCYGFFIGCCCDQHRTATYVGLGSMLPYLMVGGVIWPIEGMWWGLKPISYVLPLTKSTKSLRSIMTRGWGIDMPAVYEGFIATFIWIFIFLVLSTLCIKIKKS